MHRRRRVPVDVTGPHRNQYGRKGERCGRRGHRDRHAGDESDAVQIENHEGQHDPGGKQRHRRTRQVPRVDRGRGEDRGQPADRDPAPPVADAGEVREHRTVRPERFRTRRSNAADAVRPHQGELDPAGHCHPPEEHTDEEQTDRGTALTGQCEQRREDEQTLVATAHGQGGSPEPTDRARMCSRFDGGDLDAGHTDTRLSGSRSLRHRHRRYPCEEPRWQTALPGQRT